tara:strand:- start:1225 stop:2811 length:1587 start_codon:yes stop_codon:yes gene_type:complete
VSSLKVKREILKCAKDFPYFAERYLKIVDIHGLETTLNLNQAQQEVYNKLQTENHLMILKARKLGSTTFIAGYYLWKALFKKNTKIAVVAHTDEAAKAIFSIYQFFYKNLPNHIRVRAVNDRSNTLKLVTGSMIKVGTASSESFRGQTYQYIHASEYAFWPNLSKTIAGLFGTAEANATVILESTANGLNEAYEMWQSENGFHKMFMGWTIDARYTRKNAAFKDFSKLERQYTHKHNLTEPQRNWMVQVLRTKCANNWQIFNQEFPVSAEMAFVTSGSRFFPDPWPVQATSAGLKIYKQPQKFHVYAMGVDTASGSPGGDFSAIMVLDVSNQEKIEMVASYYDHIAPSDFGEIVHEMAAKYSALAVVESNSYGLSIIEHLQSKAYPRQYRDQYWDKVKGMFTPRYGFNTNSKSRNLLLSRLYEYITRGWCEVVDQNFMAEANALVYNSRGKVEAASGKHDDIVIATGLALMGLDQVDDIVAEVVQQQRPSNTREMIEWEMATGRPFATASEDSFAPSPLEDLFGDLSP